FAQITSNPDVQAKLRQLYGSVNNIDAWVGALAEDHVAGSSAGPLVQAVLVDQFSRLRAGDRFWFERTSSGSDLRALENTQLADVISRNSTTTNLQSNVFFFRASISGTVFNDANRNHTRDRGESGLAGVTVQLIDLSDGSVVASAVTVAGGGYR